MRFSTNCSLSLYILHCIVIYVQLATQQNFHVLSGYLQILLFVALPYLHHTFRKGPPFLWTFTVYILYYTAAQPHWWSHEIRWRIHVQDSIGLQQFCNLKLFTISYNSLTNGYELKIQVLERTFPLYFLRLYLCYSG